MAGEYLQWYDSTGTTLVSETSDFEADPGTQSATQTYRLYNDYDGSAGASTESGWFLRALAGLTSAEFLDHEGNVFLERYFLQAKIDSGGQGTPTDWTPMGPGSTVDLPPLASTEYVVVSFGIDPAADEDGSAWSFAARLEQGFTKLSLGHFEQDGSGIVSGIGDSQASFLVDMENVTPGASDGDVTIPDIRYIYQGVPYQILEQELTIGADDSAAATPGAGESFLWVITASGSGLTLTKGLLGTTPTAPDPPAGEIIVTTGSQDDTLAIAVGEIDNNWIMGRFGQVSDGTALSATAHAGDAMVNNHLVSFDRSQVLSLTANDENYGWILRDKTMQVTLTPTPPDPRAMPTWHWTTDGTGVTAVEDLRRYVGTTQHILALPFPSLTSGGGDFSFPAIWPHTRTGYVVQVSLMLDGTGSGGGSNLFDVNKIPAGVATQTTIFTSQGSQDRRPTVASAASDPHDATAKPEVLSLGFGDSLIGESDDIPVTTQPTSAVIYVLVEMA